MTPRVRLFANRDYTAFVRIRRLAEQRDISVALAREQDGHWDHSRYERIRVVAADEEDAPLGYGEIYHEPSRFDPRRYFVRLAVDPRLRRRGIGAAMWTQLRAELDERSGKTAVQVVLQAADAVIVQKTLAGPSEHLVREIHHRDRGSWRRGEELCRDIAMPAPQVQKARSW